MLVLLMENFLIPLRCVSALGGDVVVVHRISLMSYMGFFAAFFNLLYSSDE